MRRLIVLFEYFAIWSSAQKYLPQNPYVKTQFINVIGQWKVSYLGRSYMAFEGIPYAQPPTGDLRFQPPLPIVTRLNHTFEATKEPNKCIQYDHINKKVVGDEDCLYLNIYVPISSQEKLNSSLPVIIWFHEGAFLRGSGTETKAKYLMDRDVIFVTLNYRLGLFGFLSTGDDVVSGNMGLKDQNLAIRWVAKNIEHFGGDPQKISLFGASAGGSSVQYHYLSTSSAGLFRNGISFSGNALSLWAYDPEPLKTTKILAEIYECPTESSVELVKCLKSYPAKSLAWAMKDLLRRITGTPYYVYFPFVPVAEKNTSDYFIDRSPEEILKNGKVYDVPWTCGVVSDESAQTILTYTQFPKKLNYVDINWEKVATAYLSLNRTLPQDKRAIAADEIRRFYVGTGPFRNDEPTTRGLIDSETHESFTMLEKTAKLQARANKNPVKTYYYSYKATMSDVRSNVTNIGPTHLEDVYLVLEHENIDPTTTQSDRNMLGMMLDFWYTAATTGEPTLGVDWPKVNPNTDTFDFLEIAGPNNCTARQSDNFGDKKFWTNLGFDLKV